MQADLATWLASPETQAFRAYLHHRRTLVVQMFLQGNPVDPKDQGRAAAYHDLERTLSASPEDVRQTFNTALEGRKIA